MKKIVVVKDCYDDEVCGVMVCKHEAVNVQSIIDSVKTAFPEDYALEVLEARLSGYGTFYRCFEEAIF